MKNHPPACAASGCNAPQSECMGICMPRLFDLTITLDDGSIFKHTGIYPSAMEAWDCATEIFPDAQKIEVHPRPVPLEKPSPDRAGMKCRVNTPIVFAPGVVDGPFHKPSYARLTLSNLCVGLKNMANWLVRPIP